MRPYEDSPQISKTLLAWIGKAFPLREPQLKESDREVWFYVGQRSVVRFLERHYEEQTKTVLEDKS